MPAPGRAGAGGSGRAGAVQRALRWRASRRRSADCGKRGRWRWDRPASRGRGRAGAARRRRAARDRLSSGCGRLDLDRARRRRAALGARRSAGAALRAVRAARLGGLAGRALGRHRRGPWPSGRTGRSRCAWTDLRILAMGSPSRLRTAAGSALERQPFGDPRHLEHALHRLRPADQHEPVAVHPRSRVGGEDQADAVRVDELEAG